jgi:UDP-3-O-[3-hydroxymyristoyl] glucosamine N-acyltransferase
MKLSEIAKIIKGSLSGDDIEIAGVSDLDNQRPGTIGFAQDMKNLEKLEFSETSALILPPGLSCRSKPFIIAENPKEAFAKVLELFSPYKPYRAGIYPAVYIEKGAAIGAGVTILPFTSVMDNASIGDNTVIYSQVFIGKNVRIGKNCLIKAGVKIDDEAVIGDNVIIHHNSVIGGDGFGYIQKDGRNIKLPQAGRIIIEDDVEIGCGVTIDRATISETVIGKGVKIDNLVQISHNVRIGEGTVIVSQTGIAGSSTIGSHCIIAGQTGIADHAVLQDNVVVLAQSGLAPGKTFEAGSVWLGSPAREANEEKRIHASMSRLPGLIKTVMQIKKKLGMD